MVTDLPKEELKIWQSGGWEQRRYEYNLKTTDLVIDLGAYQGEFSRAIHNRYGCYVISVEPTEAIKDLTDDWARVINQAAWIREEVRRFGGNGYWTSSVLYGIQEYQCFDINDILQQETALVKMNIEGDEYPLLWHMIYARTIERVRNLQVQFHQIDNYQEEYNGLEKELSKTHRKEWSVPFIWESWQKL